jgi:hypothetical protein
MIVEVLAIRKEIYNTSYKVYLYVVYRRPSHGIVPHASLQMYLSGEVIVEEMVESRVELWGKPIVILGRESRDLRSENGTCYLLVK